MSRIGIYDEPLTHEDTHIDLTPEKVRAAIANPNATWNDMDALWFSANNSNDPEVRRLMDLISSRQDEIRRRDEIW